MTQSPRISICNRQVPLAPIDSDPRTKADIRTRSDHDVTSTQPRRILQLNLAFSRRDRAFPKVELRSHALRAGEKMSCRSRRIDHGVVRYTQRARQAFTQIGFRFAQQLLIQDLRS